MKEKQLYLAPEVEEIILCPEECVMSTVSTQGFAEDNAFDPSGFVLM